ncbi:chaplin [Streptomyces sp. H27-D2]|uniref:chaplin n=1 Tax=Streptomyces sp. H27-D2 TaxID=3046304 RepID=UPI002DBB91F4|nr:chaplin [Streptomyces sp. H27-D2]MEC4019156.1 chaplin [Streptomyces sp. H27-D2]
MKNRVAKAAALTLAGCALSVGAAGTVSAHDNPSGASASAAAIGSPGVLSGNIVQIPIHIPVNLCGNSVNAIGLLNPAIGNTCVNR